MHVHASNEKLGENVSGCLLFQWRIQFSVEAMKVLHILLKLGLIPFLL